MSVATLPDRVTADGDIPARVRRRRTARTSRWVWLFLTPTVVLYGLYTVYPIIASYWYSLVEWNGFEAEKTFVGLRNYREVLADPLFWNTFKITILFMVVTVPLKVLATLLIAILLNSPRMPFRNLLRTAFFLPVATTTAIVGVVMQFGACCAPPATSSS